MYAEDLSAKKKFFFNMITELLHIVNELDYIIPQFASFIDQFNTLIIENNVNVISDSSGYLGMDAPHGMPKTEYNKISVRLNVIDGVIDSHNTSIKSFFEKGFIIENKLRADDPNYISELVNRKANYLRLKNSYKHFH